MKNKFLPGLLKWLACAAVIFVAFWFMLPPLNPRSPEFWSFFIFAAVVCVIIHTFSRILHRISRYHSGPLGKPHVVDGKGVWRSAKRTTKLVLCGIGLMILFTVIGTVSGAEIINASRYEKLITVQDGDFAADVTEINRTQIPVVDRDTASRLGQRKLGEMSDLVSQFEIEDIYTQINYNDRPVRVTPLIYGDIIKWFNNRNEGIPAYITVDMTTQETSLVRLENGIKYSTGEYFMRNLHRYLRFRYPTKIFDNISFEVDENGTPYWVASVVSFKIGLWSGRDISGAVLVNAVTGDCRYYALSDIPSWVDQVYDAEMILKQLGYNGKYRSGYWNSIFGQKGVLQPTDGYNYLAISDDVYLYTGMTSVMSDESNVGFVLTNLRTKETKFYSIPGAEEYSAMGSAEGQVQHLKYKSTFPLLLNISDRPTYFMSLKDGAGLVKMYAFVDVKQYQIVGTGSTVEAAGSDYLQKLKAEDVEVTDAAETVVTGVIAGVGSAVVEGNTNYYILLEGRDTVYTVPISLSDRLPFAKPGDAVTLTLTGTEEQFSVKAFSLS